MKYFLISLIFILTSAIFIFLYIRNWKTVVTQMNVINSTEVESHVVTQMNVINSTEVESHVVTQMNVINSTEVKSHAGSGPLQHEYVRKSKTAWNECGLPGGARGECVALPACPQYVTLVKESNTAELGLNLIWKTQCGFEGENTKVCCPTVTEVPEPKVHNNTDNSDYVDKLPAPPYCGRELVTQMNVINSTEVESHDIPPMNVLNGINLKSREMAKYMALLGYKRNSSPWGCGGSIITKQHVLTTAHCIKESLYVVRVGELDYAQTENDFEPMDFYIKKKIPHEQHTQYHNDIGILVLAGTIPDDYWHKPVAPLCLPESGFLFEKLGPLYHVIIGWGESKEDERPTNLLYAFVEVVAQDVCKRTYSAKGRTIDQRVFCAGNPKSKQDACNGDSGGPLIASYYLPDYDASHYYQLGLISYGYHCSAERYIGVYTNITTFMPWILEKVTGKPGIRQRIMKANPLLAPRHWPITRINRDRNVRRNGGTHFPLRFLSPRPFPTPYPTRVARHKKLKTTRKPVKNVTNNK